MAEKLTKTALKTELKRRVDWYERSYPSLLRLDRFNYENESPLLIETLGSYWAYRNMLQQVDAGLFIGGGV